MTYYERFMSSIISILLPKSNWVRDTKFDQLQWLESSTIPIRVIWLSYLNLLSVEKKVKTHKTVFAESTFLNIYLTIWFNYSILGWVQLTIEGHWYSPPPKKKRWKFWMLIIVDSSQVVSWEGSDWSSYFETLMRQFKCLSGGKIFQKLSSISV